MGMVHQLVSIVILAAVAEKQTIDIGKFHFSSFTGRCFPTCQTPKKCYICIRVKKTTKRKGDAI